MRSLSIALHSITRIVVWMVGITELSTSHPESQPSRPASRTGCVFSSSSDHQSTSEALFFRASRVIPARCDLIG
jgi:hypothetical protein